LQLLKDEKDYVRDENSGAILNTNMKAYLKYKEKKKAEEHKEQRLLNLEDKLDRIESLLQGLIDGKQKS
jgi:hypothetical protein